MRKIVQKIPLILLPVLCFFLTACPLPAPAQIPAGYVQTTATVAGLANGTYGAAWTNLSSSPQLALLGCVSTFQQTVNGTFDANGHFSVLLADTSQICPSPSTWTFTLTYLCSNPPNTAFTVQVAVVGGGGTQDISSQIAAAAPASPCGGGGGGGVTKILAGNNVNISPPNGVGVVTINSSPPAGVNWPGGTQSGIPNYLYPNQWNLGTPVYNASNQIPFNFLAGVAQSGANNNITSLTGLTTPLPISEGGNGSISPGILPGSNCTVTGSWPNQTVNCTGGGGGGPGVSVTPIANPSSLFGSIATYDAIPIVTPVCDIRTYGAIINGTTPIDSAVQSCVNIVNTLYGGSGTVFLPCTGPGTGAAGCYWANMGSLTRPTSAFTKLVVQGVIQCGSTCTLPGGFNIYGDGGGSNFQFEDGNPASFLGPSVYGTLGIAITSANTATNITPVFTGGTLTNFPVGSALTIAALTSSTATAVRTVPGTYGLVTLTLASPVRIAGGEKIDVAGCSNSSFNITGGTSVQVDYTAQTLSYFQTSTTPASGVTGCTVTGPNEDSRESARILCSAGVGGTFNGVLYNSCGANQVTIMTKHTHLSTDRFGEVTAGPAFNTFTPQTWDSVNFSNSQGMAFWAEGSTNLTLHQVAAQANATLTSGAMEFSANYFSFFHDIFAAANGPSGVCPSGGCGEVSDPYAIVCDADAPVGSYYSASVSACDASVIDQNSWTVGGILMNNDSGGAQITGLPQITSMKLERTWTAGFTIDNRSGVGGSNALTLINSYLQDNFSLSPQDLLFYTDAEIPSGLVEVDNNDLAATPFTANNHFNARLSLNGISTGQYAVVSENLNAPSPSYNESGLLKVDLENKSEDFGPAMVPFASLPFTYYSASTWNTQCSTNCTATAIVGPDGPTGQMVAAEIRTSITDADITIGTDNIATYAGDVFIIGAHVRPGLNNSFTTGVIGGVIGTNNSFYISAGSSINFAPTIDTGSSGLHACAPGVFGTQLSNNGWGTEVATCLITTGYSTPSAITFHLTASNGGVTGTRGNQYAEPFWVFIPGPNNPACTAAGTCNLTNDQIELARRDQYHGFVPPSAPAGSAVTGEPTQVGSLATTLACPLSGGGTGLGCITGNQAALPSAGISGTDSFASGPFGWAECIGASGGCPYLIYNGGPMSPQTVDCHTACSPTASQLSNAIITNHGQTTANVQITGPTLTAGMNFIMTVETAQASNYWRYTSTGANIYLDGSSTPVTNIIFAAPALGNSFSCFVSPNAVFMKCTTLAGVSTSS